MRVATPGAPGVADPPPDEQASAVVYSAVVLVIDSKSELLRDVRFFPCQTVASMERCPDSACQRLGRELGYGSVTRTMCFCFEVSRALDASSTPRERHANELAWCKQTKRRRAVHTVVSLHFSWDAYSAACGVKLPELLMHMFVIRAAQSRCVKPRRRTVRQYTPCIIQLRSALSRTLTRLYV